MKNFLSISVLLFLMVLLTSCGIKAGEDGLDISLDGVGTLKAGDNGLDINVDGVGTLKAGDEGLDINVDGVGILKAGDDGLEISDNPTENTIGEILEEKGE